MRILVNNDLVEIAYYRRCNKRRERPRSTEVYTDGNKAQIRLLCVAESIHKPMLRTLRELPVNQPLRDHPEPTYKAIVKHPVVHCTVAFFDAICQTRIILHREVKI